MTDDTESNVLRYDKMVERALRGVVKQAVEEVNETGLSGDHHFYITFMTDHPDVDIPDYLKEYEVVESEKEAWELYLMEKNNFQDSPNYFLDVSEYFRNKWSNEHKAQEIIGDIEVIFSNDPVALKALAYKYEMLGHKDRALVVYLRILKKYVHSGFLQKKHCIKRLWGFILEKWFVFLKCLNILKRWDMSRRSIAFSNRVSLYEEGKIYSYSL